MRANKWSFGQRQIWRLYSNFENDIGNNRRRRPAGGNCVGGDVGMDINVNYAGGKRCQSCGRSFDTYCKYGNIERILRQDHYEECPHWIPSPTEKYDAFVSEVERKLNENHKTIV